MNRAMDENGRDSHQTAVSLARTLAAALPDDPRWLEPRAMLLTGHATITGGESAADGFVVQLVHGARSAVAVVGRPPCATIAAAVTGTTGLTPIVTQAADAPHVAGCLEAAGQAGWTVERAILHLLTAPAGRPAPAADPDVRLLMRGDSLAHLPAGLRHEITHAQDFAPVAAVFVEGRPASFCYPVWTTEGFWDVSIDTLEEHRGRSHAAHAVWFMIDLMRERGREPVWGALASNAPSLRLGSKLGFTAVDEIAVVSRGGWVFLSGGFQDA